MKNDLGLRDIQGIDKIHIWPLAIGWWLLIGVFALLTIIFLYLRIQRSIKIHSWQYQIRKRIEQLKLNLSEENSQETAFETELLMRRLALQNYPRGECAGLKGDEWLSWLSQKDPKGFNWVQFSQCLIEAPFCPDSTKFDLNSLQLTIEAAKAWVK